MRTKATMAKVAMPGGGARHRGMQSRACLAEEKERKRAAKLGKCRASRLIEPQPDGSHSEIGDRNSEK